MDAHTQGASVPLSHSLSRSLSLARALSLLFLSLILSFTLPLSLLPLSLHAQSTSNKVGKHVSHLSRAAVTSLQCIQASDLAGHSTIRSRSTKTRKGKEGRREDGGGNEKEDMRVEGGKGWREGGMEGEREGWRERGREREREKASERARDGETEGKRDRGESETHQ